MERIEIELGTWESAPCPIYTGKIKDEDLARAEITLYNIMCSYYAWSKYDVERILLGGGDYIERDKFFDAVCKEEEKLVMEIGGIYYEDMTDEEYNALMFECDALAPFETDCRI